MWGQDLPRRDNEMAIRLRWEANDDIVYETDTEADFALVNAVMCGDPVPRLDTEESQRLLIEASMEVGRQQENRRVVACIAKLRDDFPELASAGHLLQGLLERPLKGDAVDPHATDPGKLTTRA